MTKAGGFLLLLVAMALLTGCGSTPTRAPEHLVLKTTGPAGQRFHARLKIDSVQQEFDGISPAEYAFDCVRLFGDVSKTGGEGSLAFEITGTNFMCHLGGLNRPGSRISLQYDHNAVRFRLVNFRRGDQK